MKQRMRAPEVVKRLNAVDRHGESISYIAIRRILLDYVVPSVRLAYEEAEAEITDNFRKRLNGTADSAIGDRQ